MIELINFDGLNCYYNSIITVANQYSINYLHTFAELWSENDFMYDDRHDIFLSKRLVDAFAEMGMTLIKETQESVRDHQNQIKDHQFAIVEMDAFRIPWNPSYSFVSFILY